MSQADIEKAYLQATLSETIFMNMKQPEGFISETNPDWVCILEQQGMRGGGRLTKCIIWTWDSMIHHAQMKCVQVWIDQDEGLVISAMYTDDITAAGKGLGTFQGRPMHEGLAQQGRRVAVYVRNCSRAGSREGDTEPEPTRIYRTHARTFQDVRLKPRIHPTRTRHQVEEDNG